MYFLSFLSSILLYKMIREAEISYRVLNEFSAVFNFFAAARYLIFSLIEIEMMCSFEEDDDDNYY